MKLLIIIAIALLFGGGLIWMANYDPGFVLFQYDGWSVETSLVAFLVAFVVLVLVAYWALKSVVLIKQTPGKLSRWQSAKRLTRANKTLTRGLITLEEGRWSEAERLLMRYAGHSETPLLHYLAAARAAQKQNAAERRDNYLRLAHETTDGADIAVGVVQAELQLASDQKEQALATLQHLREMSPKHPYVLQQLQKLYSEMNEWQGVQDVLPDLKKRHVLPSSDVKSLSTDATVGQLESAIVKQDWNGVSTLWQAAPTKIRHSEAMLHAYASALILQDRGKEAGPLIEAYMNNEWSDRLAYQYGLIVLDNRGGQVERAERWLSKHPNNPWLLLTLGRLMKANNQTEKAERYLRESLAHGERGETYQALADVLAMTPGNEAEVLEAYQQGLSLMLSQGDALI
jgi:HemY protein